MIFQSANGYLLLETAPACIAMRAPIFGELLVEWKGKADWQARPPDAPRWEMEFRQDVDALRGYRQAVLVLGWYTLTYWPWDVVRKWRLLSRWRPVSESRTRASEDGSEPPSSQLTVE